MTQRPHAALLLTGSELTRGETQDTNGPYLATELTVLGVQVDELSLLPDSPRLLAAAIRRGVEDHDVLLISGGLGPTADDHTVSVLGGVLGREVYRHPEALERMRQRALRRLGDESKIPANYYKQAEVIDGAEVLLNPVGLAPGMAIRTQRGFLGVLPGVPRELKAMFQEQIVPYLLERFSLQPPRIFRAKIFGHGESWAEARIQSLGIDFGRVEYGISAKPGELLVKFVSHDASHHGYIEDVQERLRQAFGDDLIVLKEGLKSIEGESIDSEHAKLVHDALLAAGRTLATAESCTGGLIAKRLSDYAGSSAYLRGGVVAYADEVKKAALGVPEDLLATHGAVSEPVCRAMASGVRRLLEVDLALAVTGIAGPGGGSAEKPVGLVYVGVAWGEGPENTAVERHLLTGSRHMVRAQAAVRALELVRRRLAQGN